jgi:hypothetical protein
VLNFSPVVGIEITSPPHLQASVFPLPLVRGGTHWLVGEGWGANSDEGTDIVVL